MTHASHLSSGTMPTSAWCWEGRPSVLIGQSKTECYEEGCNFPDLIVDDRLRTHSLVATISPDELGEFTFAEVREVTKGVACVIATDDVLSRGLVKRR